MTKADAIFHTAKSNNHEVALAIPGKHSGTDIHDRYSAFETLASKTGNTQQYCWSHIISDARELEKFYGRRGEEDKGIAAEGVRESEAVKRSWNSRGHRSSL
ncbi:MAG: transposase [Thermoplasmatales archaeon]